MSILGKNIAKNRRSHRLTQAELAAQMVRNGHLTFTSRVVSKIESGARDLKFYEAMDLCEIFGATPWSLMDVDDDEDDDS